MTAMRLIKAVALGVLVFVMVLALAYGAIVLWFAYVGGGLPGD